MDTVIEKQVIPTGAYPQNDGFLGMGGIGSLLIGALLFGGGFGGFGRGNWGGGGWGGGNAGWAEAAKNDVVLNPAFQGLQTQISALSGQINQNAIADTLSDMNSGLAAAISNVSDSVNNTTRDILAQGANIAAQQQAANFTTLSSINGLGRDISAQSNQNALQQLNSFNVLTTSILQGFNNVAMQTATATNQIIAQGNALSSQLAACCCDIQNKISADGDQTRALINAINLSNIQGQLADAKAQISNFNQTQTLLDSLTRREVRCDRDDDRRRVS